MSRGSKFSDGKRTWVVCRTGEDRDGYDTVWFRGMYRTSVGPYTLEQLQDRGLVQLAEGGAA